MLKQRELAFAIVRVDLPLSQACLSDSITVKEVVATRELADREVERLSRLNSGRGCIYFATPTRVFSPGTSAGPESS